MTKTYDDRSDDDTTDGVDSELGEQLNTLAVGDFLYQQGLGKIIVVLGNVGSGKSTLLNKLVGARDRATGDYVAHFHASDHPEGQPVDSGRQPVAIERPGARSQGLAVIDSEGWGALDNDTIAVVNRTLDALKTQPCVLFIVVKFGRVEVELAKRVKLLRFCTELTRRNCFLVLTWVEQLRTDGTLAKTARQRDPSGFVNKINLLTRIDTEINDLFAVGDNVACVGHDPDTDETMNEICANMVRFTPVRSRYNYSEMKVELTRTIEKLNTTIEELDNKLASERGKLDECAKERATLVELGLREKTKHDRVTRDERVPRSFVAAAQHNSELMGVALEERTHEVLTRRVEIANHLALLEARAQRLVGDKQEKEVQLSQWRSLLGDVAKPNAPRRGVQFG